MVSPRYLGDHHNSRRRLLLLNLIEFDAPYSLPEINGRYFACFCAMDATPLQGVKLSEFCSRLLQLRCAYFCAWGPACERVHDAMDERVVGDTPPESTVGCVMTTWHADEPMEQAFEFFLNSTWPDERYAPDGCQAALIVTVGSNKWNASIESYLSRCIAAS
jgi:hypothetical protein